MPRLVVLLISLLFGANVVSAQDDSDSAIGIFGNVHLTSCSVEDGGGIITLYVGHLYTFGTTGSQWKLNITETLSSWTWLSDRVPHGMTAVGESPTGISIDYGDCRIGNFYILEVQYIGGAVNSRCYYIPVSPHPESSTGEIEGVDCSGSTLILGTEYLIVNPVDPNCVCLIGTPVHETDWGHIKALYR